MVIVLSFAMTSSSYSASDPVGDFFKRLGNSIAHPGQTPAPHKTKKRANDKSTTQKDPSPAPLTNASPTEVATNNLPPPASAPTSTPLSVRPASGIPRPSKRDLPYGVPVPGRPGFVTSPFAPTLGLVDVRNFPSGTEVKDPFTGKIFLTP